MFMFTHVASTLRVHPVNHDPIFMVTANSIVSRPEDMVTALRVATLGDFKPYTRNHIAAYSTLITACSKQGKKE